MPVEGYVKNIEEFHKEDGKPKYYKVTLASVEDGGERTDSVLPARIATFKAAKANGVPVIVEYKKSDDGRFENVDTVKLGHNPEHSEVIPEDEPKPERKTTREIAPQERGMWWKEVGENFRSGLFKKDDKGEGTALWRAYILQMMSSLEIKIEKK